MKTEGDNVLSAELALGLFTFGAFAVGLFGFKLFTGAFGLFVLKLFTGAGA